MTTLPTKTGSSKTLIYLGILWLCFGVFIIVFGLSQASAITITWQTESEQDTAGFNIYRSEQPDGVFVAINPQLIASQGSPTIGASYTYVDTTVEPHQLYYYQLEDVEFNNKRERHTIFSGTAKQLEWTHVLLSATSLALSLALLMTGIKETRLS